MWCVLLFTQHFVRDGNIIAFAVRRLACPAILDNHSGGAVRLPVVFRATMDAFTMLWNNYRFALKVELAVLFNTLIRILNSPHSKPAQKVDVLTHLEEWLKMPQNLVGWGHGSRRVVSVYAVGGATG